MSGRRFIGYLLLSVFLLTSCLPVYAQSKLPNSAAQALEKPDKAILYSLDPSVYGKGEQYFHGFKVLGKMELDNKKSIEVANIFKSAILSGQNTAATCFNPHQALQLEYNDHIYDFLICYECHQLQVF